MGKGSGAPETLTYHVRGGNSVTDINTFSHSTMQDDMDQSAIIHSTIKETSTFSTERHIGPKGLLNVGNSCYANAVLQCLLSTALTQALEDPSASAIFRRYSSNPAILAQGSGSVDSDEEVLNDSSQSRPRRKSRERRKLIDESSMHDNCEWLSRELNRITREYHAPVPTARSAGMLWLGANTTSKPAVVDPGSITRQPHRLSSCLRPYQQEDAHEFLRSLLGTLVKQGHNKELSSLFDGLLESAVVCQSCRRPSLTRDRYMDLSLDIQGPNIQTLEDALKEFTKTEILTGENKVSCSRCKTKRTATKGLRLATAPSILVTHLKRFAFDPYGRLVRLGKKVKFPLNLEIGDYMSRVNKARPPPYELVAVLVHQGVSCEYGHYLAYVKQCGDWYRCNDSSVEIVDVETVLSQQAYILMYEVAEMREKHGFPSPNMAVRRKSSRPQRQSPMDMGFNLNYMLCGIDYDFANVCKYATAFGKPQCAPQPRTVSRRGRRPGERSLDDDDIVAHERAEEYSQDSDKRKPFIRCSSSGNLNRLNDISSPDRFQSRSLSVHRRHRRPSSVGPAAAAIQPSPSPEDVKRNATSRKPQKGELPPRPSGTPTNRRHESEKPLSSNK